jgi:uncharacterized membrane protein YbhN (UPF0104 family)
MGICERAFAEDFRHSVVHMTTKRLLVLLVTTLAVMAIAGVAVRYLGIDIARVGEILVTLDSSVFALAMALSLAQVYGQIARFLVLIRDWSVENWRLVLRGQLLNSTLPLRAGDAYKFIVLTRAKVGAARSASIILAERAGDLGTIFLFSLVASPAAWITIRDHFGADTLFGKPMTWILLLAAVLLGGVVLALRGPDRIQPLISAFKEKGIALTFLWSGIAWILEYAAVYYLVRSAGVELGIADVIWAVFILNLGITINVTIGNLGIFEATLAFALIQLGVSKESAIAIAILYHAKQLLSLIVWWAGSEVLSARERGDEVAA